MKTLQQAIDALDPAELKRRKRRLRKQHIDPHGCYYFPGQRVLKVSVRDVGSDAFKQAVRVDGVLLAHTPEYIAWAADPTNVRLYTGLFYAANKIKA